MSILRMETEMNQHSAVGHILNPKTFLDDAIATHALRLHEMFANEVERFLKLSGKDCGSPIEKLLLDAIVAYAIENEFKIKLTNHVNFYGTVSIDGLYPVDLIITQQWIVGKYRADFKLDYECPDFLSPNDKKIKKSLVVECDGHDFHDKTKDQAQRDKARDRVISSCGIQVFRFTGSEIHRDPEKCVREIFKFLSSEGI